MHKKKRKEKVNIRLHEKLKLTKDCVSLACPGIFFIFVFARNRDAIPRHIAIMMEPCSAAARVKGSKRSALIFRYQPARAKTILLGPGSPSKGWVSITDLWSVRVRAHNRVSSVLNPRVNLHLSKSQGVHPRSV